ncbi:class I SAM-dependent methyltransferase [Chrysiogenes arsenatis]|uniref:class I SAM-dependent methyltransferase n=1 Tax=Chrysiogenes arsenatis TaxID=309797 RepID=UPI0003F9B14B|nr:class I SAM-dependent methyltransferase [Chrysiogenes arsenatis]
MSRVLYQQYHFPVLQNRVYDSAAQAQDCPKGDIEIIENQQTGLIYNTLFKPELITYDSNYNNEQGVSQRFRDHLNQVAELIETFLGKENLIEVGCGKGFFLEMLLQRGADIIGFDTTYDGSNPRVVKKYFEPETTKTPAKGLVLRHVLEHIPNPIEFLFQLRQANREQGLIYIEVPCFDWICKKRAWFDIFYEHVNYFRLADFDRFFEKIIDSGRLFGEQYIYVIADLSTLRAPVFEPSNAVDFPLDFLSHLFPKEQDKKNYPTCIWGGASKGVIFSLLRERIGEPVDCVIDVNPAKQGMFLPGTGLLVQSPERALRNLPIGTPIYVMNSNYLEEIKTMSNHKFKYLGVDQ